ncbi:MAG: hypothetical protein ACR2GN_07750 [Bacteroidia bacterium]
MKAIVCSLLASTLLLSASFSQDNIETPRSDLGVIFSIMGNKPLDLNSYNKDFNLVQTNIAVETSFFYRKYLGKMFDLQLEIATGNRYLNIQDTTMSYRLTDIYYTFNILPVFKFRDD